MKFFDHNFFKKLGKSHTKTKEDNFQKEDGKGEFFSSNNSKLDVNKKNQEKFKSIMDNASTKYDSYWDVSNPIITAILGILFIIIVIGLLYYIVGWVNMF